MKNLLNRLFVGNDVVATMAALQDQGTDWLKAWKVNPVVEPEDFQDPVENVFPVEEEIPF